MQPSTGGSTVGGFYMEQEHRRWMRLVPNTCSTLRRGGLQVRGIGTAYNSVSGSMATNQWASPCRSSHLRPPPSALTKMFNTLLERSELQEQALRALATIVQETPAQVFAQDIPTLAIHKFRPGDSAHTACGWSAVPARQRRGQLCWLSNIVGQPWNNLCERSRA